MSNVLLGVLFIVCVIGALFTVLVAIGVGLMCQKNQEDIRELKNGMEDVKDELARVNEFNHAVTECVSCIGQDLDGVHKRTDWLNGIDGQVARAFSQNKDKKES